MNLVAAEDEDVTMDLVLSGSSNINITTQRTLNCTTYSRFMLLRFEYRFLTV